MMKIFYMVKFNPSQAEPVKEIRDQMGALIEKVYNPSVGTYDVMVTTGPGYMTKRQEALDAMSQILQSNPQLWTVAGDLFIKNMDWPGAQEMAKRFAKTIDPKLLSNEDDPALQAANQQMQAMGQEMQQMQAMLQNVSQSMEAQTLKVKEFEAEVKAYDAETKRISAVQAGMSEEQIQDIAMGVVAAAMESQSMMNQMPEMREESMPMDMMPQGMEQMPPDMGQMPQQGLPQ